MEYKGMPMGMWVLFAKSFEEKLVRVLHFNKEESKVIRKKAEKSYKEIIAKLPEFAKEDRFKMNIVNCALLSAFYLSMDRKPSLEEMTQYYKEAMMIKPMLLFCKISGKNKFSKKDIESLNQSSKRRDGDRNPYSWNFDVIMHEDGYTACFTSCGICTLMKELGIEEIIPAMCRLDYTMSEASGASIFKRDYTLASGGPYCDCRYIRK